MELQLIVQHDLAVRRALRHERVYRDRMDHLAFSDDHPLTLRLPCDNYSTILRLILAIIRWFYAV